MRVRSVLLGCAVGVLVTASSLSAAFMGEDIVILIDISGSTGSAHVQGEKDFVKRLNNVMPNRAGTRLSIVQFSSSAQVFTTLAGTQNVATLDSIIDNVTFSPASSTNPKAAVQKAIDLFDQHSDPLDPKVAIMLTDDGTPFSLPTNDPTSLTAALQSRGISLLVAHWNTPLWSGYGPMAAATGGAIFQYGGPFTSATADQFLGDASAYFNLGPIPEPGSFSLALAGLAMTLRRARRRA